MIKINETTRISGDTTNYIIEKLTSVKSTKDDSVSKVWEKQPYYCGSLEAIFSRLLVLFDKEIVCSEKLYEIKEFVEKRENFKTEIKVILYGDSNA